LLKDIGQNVPLNVYGGVGREFEGIYRSLFRNRTITQPEHADFLRVAFLEFAMDRLGPRVVDDKSSEELLDAEPQPFVNLAEFEARIRMQQKTAARLVKSLNLSSRRAKSGMANAIFAGARQDACPSTAPCDRGMVPDIIRQGFLHRRVMLVDLRIADESGASFRGKYISLAAIAEAGNTSSRELIRRCGERSVSMLLMPMKRQGLQTFIRVADQGKLSMRCLSANPI
jgi:hypothetical protein